VLDGRGADVRSDVYALGLVLYEIYTGKRAFRADTMAELVKLQREATPTSPSQLITDLDPAVERVLARCLEKDPARRPASAIAVAAALPGGDPLQAALAAGEIPSLEMVANAGSRGGIRSALGAACVAAVLAALLVFVFVGSKARLYRYDPLEKPPAVLADRAREMLASFGYPEKPADAAHGFQRAGDTLGWIARSDSGPDRWETLRDADPAGYFFWYRESPNPMVPRSLQGFVTPGDPPDDVRGRCYLSLDTTGRLRTLSIVPPARDDPDSVGAPEPDWSVLFAAAGLAPADFQEARPEWVPDHYADRRVAWVGPEVRIEAASHRGLPVEFRRVGPWTRDPGRDDDPDSLGERIFIWFLLSAFLTVLLGAVFLAVRNVRHGRGDQVGARRLSLVYFVIQLAIWALISHHPADFNAEINQFLSGVAAALLGAAVFWTFYLALEPYGRRTWPNLLVAWSRVVTGRFRDPLVGRDILVGGVFFLFNVALDAGSHSVARAMGYAPGAPEASRWLATPGPLPTPAYLMAATFNAFVYALFILTLLMMLRLLVRNHRAAIVVFAALVAALTYFSAPGDAKLVGAAEGVLIGVVWAAVLFRFGLVTFVVGTYFTQVATGAPLTFDMSTWYSGASLATMAVILGITGFGLHAALAGRALPEDSTPSGRR
jgi:serine/threonine-protein kinase